MSQIAIDFLLGKSLSSRLIAWYGCGYNGYSHCASVLDTGNYLDARSDVIAGVAAGVQIRDPKTEGWVKKRRATLEVTPQEYQCWQDSLTAKINAPYDKAGIEGFVLGQNRHTGGNWFCSALAINAVQHLSRYWKPPHLGFIPYPLPYPAHQISPDIALYIIATAGFTIGPEELK